MNFKSVNEIIAYAIEKEEEAVAFYTEISENESLQGVKKTFEDFANEEKKHVKMLQDLSGNKAKIAEYEFKWIPDMKRSDYMVDITYEKGMHYTEILRLAMKREEKSLQLSMIWPERRTSLNSSISLKFSPRKKPSTKIFWKPYTMTSWPSRVTKFLFECEASSQIENLKWLL